ncbi:hypothetical protein AAE478_002892 [Parahypoxylon ruwenzoriense]
MDRDDSGARTTSRFGALLQRIPSPAGEENAATRCHSETFGSSFQVINGIYSLFLHPLREFPGPVLWRASGIPRAYHLLRGDLPFVVAKYHAKYGSTVRISPDELTFSDPQAWKDIYGHRSGGLPDFPKLKRVYKLTKHIPTSILNSERDEHALLRRQLSHGFSDKSMREQEPFILGYVNLLIQRIHENSRNGTVPLNMREWFNFTTFDIIGDLGFGSSFGLLRNSSYHPWVRLITNTIKETAFFQALAHLGWSPLMDLIFSCGLMRKNDEHMLLVREKLQERIKLGYERPDFIEGLIKKKEDWHMDLEKLATNASILLIAGSETTATLLSGAVFLLTTHPDKLAKVVEEVRSVFKSEDEINLMSVSKLNYLRRYPPVTGELPRITPKGGATVLGKFVPEDTVVSVWQFPINHDPRWWKDPMEFVPERWTESTKFMEDRLDAMQAFSFGPRNCIGKNLAYAEMRLILAKIVYNFDMTIADDSRGWLTDQKAYIVWDKPPLNIYMTPVSMKSG